MKRALVISSEFPPLPGGIGNHAHHLSTYLQNSGCDVEVVTDFRSQERDSTFDQNHVCKVHRIKRNALTPINRLIKAFTVVKRNQAVICSGKFPLWTGGLLKVFFRNKKYIAILHGSEIRAGGTFSKALTQWSLNRFEKIIAVSNFTKERALKFQPNLQIDVINNGFEMFKSNSLDEKIHIQGQPKIITIGNVTYRKGQHNVIKALPFLKKTFPEIHYHCIGIPTERNAFLKLALQLDVEKNITFHGALPETDLVAILKESDVFLMLSDVLENGDFEGFGIAILEANALGKPAIGSNNSGIRDAIKSGFSGELVDPKSNKEISDALMKILNNYDFYTANAIQWSTEFTWEKVGRKYREILER